MVPALVAKRTRKTISWITLATMLTLAGCPPSVTWAAGEGSQCWGAESSANRCCPSASLASALPYTPSPLSQTLCEVLVFPSEGRAEGDLFRRLVVSESLVRDSAPAVNATTLPSLWWNRDSIPARLGGHRLVESWLAYQRRQSSTGMIDLVVSPQFWRGLTLPERYGVLVQFGQTAEELGYHLRLLDNNGYTARLVGVYACVKETCLASADGEQLLQLQQRAIAQSAPAANP